MGRMERCPEKTGKQGAAGTVKGDIMRFIPPGYIAVDGFAICDEEGEGEGEPEIGDDVLFHHQHAEHLGVGKAGDEHERGAFQRLEIEQARQEQIGENEHDDLHGVDEDGLRSRRKLEDLPEKIWRAEKWCGEEGKKRLAQVVFREGNEEITHVVDEGAGIARVDDVVAAWVVGVKGGGGQKDARHAEDLCQSEQTVEHPFPACEFGKEQTVAQHFTETAPEPAEADVDEEEAAKGQCDTDETRHVGAAVGNERLEAGVAGEGVISEALTAQQDAARRKERPHLHEPSVGAGFVPQIWQLTADEKHADKSNGEADVPDLWFDKPLHLRPEKGER